MEIKKKILVVEDDNVYRKMLCEELSSLGFDLLSTDDGEEGLAKAIAEHPDLILLDLILPGLDGISFIKEIRKDEWGKKARIIVLTNYSSNEKIAEILEAGVHDYMDKSVSAEEIKKSVRQKLNLV